MNILVACEESQRVCIELRKRGHNAFSCDVIDCSGGHPEWHIKQDVLPLINGNCTFTTTDNVTHSINGKWDMIIAFPPCTYMSNAGACRMYPQKGVIDEERLKLGLQAKAFFMSFYNADCDKIAIENPVPLRVIELPEKTQVIQPYEFGHPYTKKTYLWLKGLPKLNPTNIVKPLGPYVCGNAEIWKKQAKKGVVYGKEKSAKHRSKTFMGIAEAMAEQWTVDINEEVINVKKVEEIKTITYECNDLIDVAALKEKEPELYEELVRDYPAESATYVFKNVVA